MATAEIYLKVSGRYYPCEPKKAWLRKHLPVMVWVWQFERKLMGAKWQVFISWNMSCPIVIHRMKVMQISKDGAGDNPIVLDPIQAQSTIGAEWEIPDNIAKPAEGVDDGE